jgi:hypothetical protein
LEPRPGRFRIDLPGSTAVDCGAYGANKVELRLRIFHSPTRISLSLKDKRRESYFCSGRNVGIRLIEFSTFNLTFTWRIFYGSPFVSMSIENRKGAGLLG